MARHNTIPVKIGKIVIGGNSPIVVQSMTNTDTSNVLATTKQVIELYEAGSEIVRVTVNNEAAARGVVELKNALIKRGYTIPIVGCFHYNGHTLLRENRDCAQSLDKFRINPGNVGFGKKRDKQFEEFIGVALEHDKPIRIGVNWGSLDQDLAMKLMEENSKLPLPLSSNEVEKKALVLSTLLSAQKAEKLGLNKDRIVISCKTSRVADLVEVYRELAKRSNYALHLGLTEAGMGLKGVVATTSALSILLKEGIGDTIRASLTPSISELRSKEVTLCCEILQSINLRSFNPEISSCPGCGRTTSTYFQVLTQETDNYIKKQMPIWQKKYPDVVNLKVAVMGCIVNGPGESKHANIGISLPGTGESPVAPVFIDGKKTYTLRGDNISKQFQEILEYYVHQKYSTI